MGKNNFDEKEYGRNYNLLGQFNILYIEDELKLFKDISDILGDFVKKVYGALNIKEAHEIIKNENIDAIVSDIMLKDESSLGFLKNLKFELGVKTPIILISVFSNIDLIMEAIKLNAESYIIKPIKAKELLNCLYDALLPKIQQKEIGCFYDIIKTVTTVSSNRQVEVILFIIKNLDENSILNYSYEDVAKNIDASKTTVAKIFKQLLDSGILVKIRNRKYFFDKNKL